MITARKVGTRIRIGTSRMSVSAFVSKFIELSSVQPALSDGSPAGEIFLATRAFAKLVQAGDDDKLSRVFKPVPVIDPKTGVLGTVRPEGSTFEYSVRTNVFQHTGYRDYENLGEWDMELRVYV